MSTITTRSGKGTPLTNNELDSNFTSLNSDKLESGDLSVTTGSASGSGSLTYSDTAFSFAPADLSSYITDLSSFTTDDLGQGSSNLYFSDALARGAVSLVTDNAASLAYNSTTGVFTYTDPASGTVAASSRVITDVRNETGIAIPAGSAVYITGSSGNNTLVALADANGTSTYPATGIILSSINNNANGEMVTLGEVTGFNTTGLAGNTVLYLSETPGQLTATRPSSETTAVQNIARVVRGGITNGTIIVLGSGRANDIPNLATGHVFIGDGSGYEARDLVVADISDLTATSTELNYTDGVTSNIQTQLDNKQPLSSVLTSTTASFTTAEETKLAGIETGAEVNDPTTLLDADIGVTVQAYDATIVVDADIGVTVQGYDATLLNDADIGVSVQGYSAVLAGTTASFTTADETKLDNIETGATADQTASEILTALLTVDGTGTGLDADLLDGNHSTAFATAAQGTLADSALQSSDIGVSVQGYDATIVVDADIGVSVQGYSSVLAGTTASFTTAEESKLSGIATGAEVNDPTTVLDADIGVTVQGYDSTIVVDADIGVTVLAYDSNLQSVVAAFTIPTTDGTTGQALITDGAGTISFGNVDALPSQTGNDGYYLSTDGTTASWAEVSSLAYVRSTFTATAAQTTFTVAYTVGYADVYMNGVKLFPADFTATNGTSIVLASGAAVGDLVEVVAFNTFNVANALTSANIGVTVQVYDADTTTATNTQTLTNKNFSGCTVDGTDEVGFRSLPQNSQSADYTAVLTDSGKHIYHPTTDANARTYTIDSNANVAYPIGTALTFVNMTAEVITIAITSDTMYLSDAGTTGSRSLAQYGSATALKLTATTWLISGSGLT